MKVLVTCGPTWVAIDDVRVISNTSSGQMGHLMAQEFKAKGAQVTMIEGPITHVLSGRKVKIIKYRFFDELAAALKAELKKHYDIIVHAAAVSDFKVAAVSRSKIASGAARTLKLVPAPKLIKEIKLRSPRSFLVGFKLESNFKELVDGIKALFRSAHCDLVVGNIVKDGYRGFIVNPQGEVLYQAGNKKTLAHNLVKQIMAPGNHVLPRLNTSCHRGGPG